MSPTHAEHGVTYRQALRVWAYIGLNSFGGPSGQIAVMHRELIDQRKWVSERRFMHALNYCMVLPGPEAQQLATYIGWLMHGVRGGITAGLLFILPGFVAMMALSIVYALWGSVTAVSGLLSGLQAAVIVIVVQAFVRISRRILVSTSLRFAAGLSFVAIFVFGVPFPIIIVAAGLFGFLFARAGRAVQHLAGADEEAQALLRDDLKVERAHHRSALKAAIWFGVIWVAPVVALVIVLGQDSIFTQEALFFSKAALVTFGGAYAVLGYVAQQAVEHYGWITTSDMTTGLGLAETTPGPLIMVVQFVGFLGAYNNPGDLPPLVAGVLGAIVTVWVTFVPCFLFIFLGAPYAERLRENSGLSHALTYISAAVAGVILNLAVWFALNTIFTESTPSALGPIHVSVPVVSSVNEVAIAIGLVAAVLVFRFKMPTLKVLAICSALGLAAAFLPVGS
ncbi:MAG: chromate efflux transporter [Actinomycetota bacterium]|nr:chromate efflux transporter [Actinomycetota bacterium]